MNDTNLVNSVLKSMDVLKLVGDSDNGLRLSEIADALDMKLPAAHNLIRTLLCRGFLEKHNNNRLYIGTSFMEIAENQLNKSMMKAAERELMYLHKIIPDGIIVFGLATASEIRQMLRISYDRPNVFQRLKNDRFHPYGSASGLLGLAFLPAAAVLQLEERYPFAEYGSHLWKNEAVLEEFLEKVRQEKLVVCPFSTEKFYRIAVPVFDQNKHLIAAIGISLPVSTTGKLQRKKAIEELKQAARRLEKE